MLKSSYANSLCCVRRRFFVFAGRLDFSMAVEHHDAGTFQTEKNQFLGRFALDSHRRISHFGRFFSPQLARLKTGKPWRFRGANRVLERGIGEFVVRMQRVEA